MPSILNNSSATITNTSIANAFGDSLLSVGRQIGGSSKYKIGLSASARSGVEDFLSATQGGYNQLFSLAAGPSLDTQGLQTQIKGLRARIPQSQLAAALQDDNADNGGTAASSTNGTNVDTTA